MALVYCFLFMEETNYDRPAKPAEGVVALAVDSDDVAHQQDAGHVSEKPVKPSAGEHLPQATAVDRESGQVLYPRKTYLQKLGLKDRPRQNRMLDVALGGLRGFSYPSVLYAGRRSPKQNLDDKRILIPAAGLMYGANNLVWSGIQNATAGTVYTTMYGFSTAGVAAAYAGGLLGTVIGCVIPAARICRRPVSY